MTGEQVFRLRREMCWSGPKLGRFLGVAASTIYRWEDAQWEGISTADGLSHKLLCALRDEHHRRTPEAWRELVRSLDQKLDSEPNEGENLEAVRVLLEAVGDVS
jgi:transcriptional regulator with XRE-family HTH domain